MRHWGQVAVAVVLCAISAAAGSALSRHLGDSTYTISYADFISVMLTGISLLMALLAFFIAILAFIGWNSISSKVASEVSTFLAAGFKDGEPLHRMLVDQTSRAMYEGVIQVDEEFQEEAAQADSAVNSGAEK